MALRVCLFVFALLFGLTQPSVAQEADQDASDPRLSESRDGQLESKKHQATLDSLLARHDAAIDREAERFKLAASLNVKRYTSQLDKLVRQLTREGDVESAADLQNMLFQANQWAVVPPDQQGKHFLSEVILTDSGNADANRIGGELAKLVDESAQTYLKQVELAFDDYADQVDAARDDYCTALRVVINAEHRAGQLEAYRQVQAEIRRVTELPRLQRPRPDGEQADEPGEDVEFFGQSLELGGATGSFRGFFLAEYQKPDGQTKFRFLIELTEGGGHLYAAMWGQNLGAWKQRDFTITITERTAGHIVFEHDTQGGKTAVHRLTLQDGWPVKDEVWWNKGQYGNGKPSEQGKAIALGTPVKELNNLPAGEVFVDVHSSRAPNGTPQSRKGRYRVSINNGVIAMMGAKWDRLGGAWQPMAPRVMGVEQVEGGYILRYDKQATHLTHVFALDMPQGADPSLRIWWNAADFDSGKTAAATGSLSGKWLSDLKKLGFEFPLAD